MLPLWLVPKSDRRENFARVGSAISQEIDYDTGVSGRDHGNEELGHRYRGAGYCCVRVHSAEEIGLVFTAGGVVEQTMSDRRWPGARARPLSLPPVCLPVGVASV